MIWHTNRPRPIAWAVRNYEDAIASGDVSHDGNPTFIEHIRHARRRKLTVLDDKERQMHTLCKDTIGSPRKIDARDGRRALLGGALGLRRRRRRLPRRRPRTRTRAQARPLPRPITRPRPLDLPSMGGDRRRPNARLRRRQHDRPRPPSGTAAESWLGRRRPRPSAGRPAGRAPSRRRRPTPNSPTPSRRPPDQDAAPTDERELQEELGARPGPEQPTEVEIYAEDSGTVVVPAQPSATPTSTVDDAYAGAASAAARTRDASARSASRREPIEGEQVESSAAPPAAHGLVLVDQRQPATPSTAQMAAALKQAVDKAVVGLAL